MNAIDFTHVTELLTRFNAINAISGYESPVADALARHMAPLTDSQERDALGNCICLKRGRPGGKTVLLTAHMDEIGFLVCDITKEGFLTLVPVGMHNPAMLTNQVYTIHTRGGDLYGVVAGGKPVHVAGGQSAPMSVGDLRLDVGCSTPEEVAARGIRVGDPVNIEKPSRMLTDTVFCGKAVDNRSGVAALILAMELLKDADLSVSVYACGTVQEEIGIKGARVLTQHLHPDCAVTVDVGFAAENDDPNPSCTRVTMGKGASIQLYDWNPGSFLGIIVPRSIADALEEAAQHAGVPYQTHVNLNGGTDAGEMSLSNGGVPTGSISLPERYMHTTVGTVDVRDVASAAAIMAQFVLDMDARG